MALALDRGRRALDQPVILVVEDDQEIQTIVEDALTEAGFAPAIAPSGEEAVTLLRGNRSGYRALVTDVRLRGRMDGWERARQAREIDPDFPIIYITGANGHQWPAHGVPNSVLLQKPFAPAQLVTVLFPASAMAGSPGPRARHRSCTRRRKRQRAGVWPCCALAIVSALTLDDGARTFWFQVPNWRRDEAPPVPFQFRKARRLGRKSIGERWDNWIRAPALILRPALSTLSRGTANRVTHIRGGR